MLPSQNILWLKQKALDSGGLLMTATAFWNNWYIMWVHWNIWTLTDDNLPLSTLLLSSLGISWLRFSAKLWHHMHIECLINIFFKLGKKVDFWRFILHGFFSFFFFHNQSRFSSIKSQVVVATAKRNALIA